MQLQAVRAEYVRQYQLYFLLQLDRLDAANIIHSPGTDAQNAKANTASEMTCLLYSIRPFSPY